MKLNYKKNQLIISITILLITVQLYFVNYCFNNYIKSYKTITGVVISNNIVQVMVDNDNLKRIYNNKYIFIDNKKYYKENKSITKNIMKKGKTNYHSILLKIKLNKKYKTNDAIIITIYDKKIKIISMFKIW